MADQTIATWTPADLRRFVVNNILTDPGAYPKQPKDNTPTLPTNPGLDDGDVPVWDTSSQRWVTSSSKYVVPNVSYFRGQGTPAGFLVDANFRIYNWSSLGTLYAHDPTGYFNNNGSYFQFNKACTCAISMQAVGPNAGNYTLGFSPVYNGVTIDSVAGSISWEGSAGTIQLMSSVGFTIARFNAGDYIQIGGFCNSGVPTVSLVLMVLPT